MKTYNLEIIKSAKEISADEQTRLKKQLKVLLKQKGIVSLCLDSKYLFVEYNADYLALNDLAILLREAEFPLKSELKLAS